jgi:uncharacterized spore protein YtfJ
MSEDLDGLMQSIRQEADARAQTLQTLVAGADAAHVFGPPVTEGEYAVIPAGEIARGVGLGSGMGLGPKEKASGPLGEAGGGGGGGGGARGRPVAAIVIGPDGVTVKPVVDVTKLALTGLGAALVIVLLSMRILRKR